MMNPGHSLSIDGCPPVLISGPNVWLVMSEETIRGLGIDLRDESSVNAGIVKARPDLAGGVCIAWTSNDLLRQQAFLFKHDSLPVAAEGYVPVLWVELPSEFDEPVSVEAPK